MRVGSLFSGIGGLDLGLERAGMTVVWQSEIDSYASRVLAKHWPHVPNLGDITTIDWSTVEPVDIICGGYPCQPFSLAGSRAGTADARHLWPHFADALRVVRPRWALLENVPGHLSMGFGDVLGDLAELGFDAQWDCIPAAAVGAPHLRYRLFVVAHAGGARRRENTRSTYGDEGADEGRAAQHHHVADGDGEGGRAAALADPDSRGLEVGTKLDSESVEDSTDRHSRRRHIDGLGHEMADTNGEARHRSWGAGEAILRPAPLERSGRRGGSIGHDWAAEPDVGRVAHGISSRVDRLKCLGNAVVPQVAEYVGRRIMEAAA